MRLRRPPVVLLGNVYELDECQTPFDDLVARLPTIIDEAFGRTGEQAPAATA